LIVVGGFRWEYADSVKQEDIPDEKWEYTKFTDLINIKVSDYGRVQYSSGQISYGSKNPLGYMKTQLQQINGGNPKGYFVHQLVMLVFKGEANGRFVNHIDSCRHNNKLSNLEYVTAEQNILHAVATGRHTGTGKLKIIQYSLEGKYIATHDSMSQASKASGAKSAVIVEVCKRRPCHHTAGGFKWRYHTTWGDGKDLAEYDALEVKMKDVVDKDGDVVDEEVEDVDTSDDETDDDEIDDMIDVEVKEIQPKLIINLSKLGLVLI
jgi:hypothetical protein